VIDLHSHVLHGLDDGPATLAGSIALARAAADGGTRTLVATPHVNESWQPDPERIAVSVAALQLALARQHVEIEIVAGAEIAYSRLADLDDHARTALALGRSPWLLIEPPYDQMAGDFDHGLAELALHGTRIALAHPERCPTFQREPERLRNLVEAGLLCQVTASSLSGRFGGDVRRFALELLRDGLVHVVASDAHDHSGRPPGLAQGLDAAVREIKGLEARREWLTEAMPAAILAGSELPPPPPGRARRSLRGWLSGR
jgi:protein-tyrosine phosphatase